MRHEGSYCCYSHRHLTLVCLGSEVEHLIFARLISSPGYLEVYQGTLMVTIRKVLSVPSVTHPVHIEVIQLGAHSVHIEV